MIADQTADAVDHTTLPPDTVSVSQLSNRVAAAVSSIPQGWVAGEILLAKRAAGKHLYFELVDRPDANSQPTAKVQVMVQASDVARFHRALSAVGLELTDGLPVRIFGRMQLWAPSGGLTFRASAIDGEFSAGRIAGDRHALLRKLEREGILAAQAKLRMPGMPLDVLLITSGSSAAYADFTRHLAESGIGFRTCHIDVRVQGADAPRELTWALRAATASIFPAWRPDVVVVLRGGGSRADLAAFDTEEVARAICACPVPVICGVGHEIDASVADSVAFLSAKTPTAAAAALIERVTKSETYVEKMYARAGGAATARFARADDGLASHLERAERAAQRMFTNCAGDVSAMLDRALRAAERTCVTAEQRVEVAFGRVGGAAESQLRAAAERLDARAAIVRAHDPQLVLARGFSITRTEDGTVVADASCVDVGTVLETTLAVGTVTSTVSAAAEQPVVTGQEI